MFLTEKRIAKNRAVGAFLIAFALLGFALIAHRLCHYIYEYDAQYSPVNYGKYNILSYFTVQSNFFAYVYFLCAGLGICGCEKAKKIGFNSCAGALVTVYVLVAGVTYCAGFPMKLTPPLKWDGAYHAMQSFIQVYYHMIMPPLALALWFFPFRNEKLGKKCVLLSGVYPFIYSVFSIIRGAFSDPEYYPYPFYNPAFVWQAVRGDESMNTAAAYGIIAVLLVFGISLFMGITALIVLIHNKRVKIS